MAPCAAPSSAANSACLWVESPGANLTSHLPRFGLHMWQALVLRGRIWRCCRVSCAKALQALICDRIFRSRILILVTRHQQLAFCSKQDKGRFILNNYNLLKLPASEKKVEPNITHKSQKGCSKRMREMQHVQKNTVKRTSGESCQMFLAGSA